MTLDDCVVTLAVAEAATRSMRDGAILAEQVRSDVRRRDQGQAR